MEKIRCNTMCKSKQTARVHNALAHAAGIYTSPQWALLPLRSARLAATAPHPPAARDVVRCVYVCVRTCVFVCAGSTSREVPISLLSSSNALLSPSCTRTEALQECGQVLRKNNHSKDDNSTLLSQGGRGPPPADSCASLCRLTGRALPAGTSARPLPACEQYRRT